MKITFEMFDNNKNNYYNFKKMVQQAKGGLWLASLYVNTAKTKNLCSLMEEMEARIDYEWEDED